MITNSIEDENMVAEPTVEYVSRHSFSSLPTKRTKSEKPKVNSETEKYMEEIRLLKEYVDDLRNGRPVENPSPSNDPYFLVPENIEAIIRGTEDLMHGRYREIDPDNIWGCIE